MKFDGIKSILLSENSLVNDPFPVKSNNLLVLLVLQPSLNTVSLIEAQIQEHFLKPCLLLYLRIFV